MSWRSLPSQLRKLGFESMLFGMTVALSTAQTQTPTGKRAPLDP
eukprot:CAMPEP_0171106684 /NCGR_PEP_ID=MMETSP0766_2-20121228/65293_1 /TAXON_ID=439317 /ORGANISM="Gambierdiscus australes, Strain CAWD 149" /LENGTH=43 /DNA_ID= /DNA_START= /DNA_END= /DNA_ORIENTATION=